MKLKTKFMALMLLMAVVGQSAWANITFNYNSSTSTLTFDGDGDDVLNPDDVKKANGYLQAKHIKIGGGIKTIEYQAFASAYWSVEDIEFCWSNYGELETKFEAFISLDPNTFICNRDYNKWGEGESRRLFKNCPTTVKVGQYVRTISASSFIYGSVSSLDLSQANDLTIKENAFHGCKIQNLVISSGVKSIGNYAFKDAIKGALTIEESTTPIEIGIDAFKDLTTANVYRAYSGYIDCKAMILGANVTSVGRSYATDVRIMGNGLFNSSYTESSNLSKEFVNIKNLCLDPQVTKVSSKAFYGSKTLEKLIYNCPANTAIAADAFANCPKLLTVDGVTFPEAKWWNAYKAIGMNFTELTPTKEMAEYTEYDDDYASTRHNLHYVFPNITKLTFGSSVNSIGDYIYSAWTGSASKLTEIVFEGSAITVGLNAFAKNEVLTTVTTGKMSTIGASAFNSCLKLSEINLSGCRSIGNWAFDNCQSLRSIVIPYSVSSLGEKGCFNGCPLLKNVEINSSSLINADYTGAEKSLINRFGAFVENAVINNASIIGKAAFSNAPSLTSVTIGSKATTIYPSTFEGSTKLKNVTFAGKYVFELNGIKDWSETDNVGTCFPYVENLTLPDGTHLGKYAFFMHENLKTVNGDIVAFNNYCFAGCTNLESVSLVGGDNSTVGAYAFMGCSKLTNVTLNEGIWGIEKDAFMLTGLKEIALPASCELLENWPFAGCTLTKVIVRNPDFTDFLDEDGFDENAIKANKTALDVPMESLAAYKKHDIWGKFYDIFVIGGVKLVDGEPYTRTVSEVVPMVRYTRNFSTSSVNKWQALCIPFSIDMVSNDYEIGKILVFCPVKDTNGDGTIDGNDESFLIVSPCKSGKTEANVPYMIRPKKSGDIVFTEENCTLHAANAGELHFSTTENSYSVYGLLQNSVVATVENQYYYMSATGNLNHRTTGSTTVKPNRWYLTMSKKTYGSDEIDDMSSNAREIQIFTIGEDMDEATAIGIIEAGTGHKSEKVSDNSIYTLSGMKVDNVDNLPAGIYVKNGKKFVVK